MKIKFSALVFLLFCIKFMAQTHVTGIILNENNIALQSVLITNISTDAKTYSDQNGAFSITANSGDQLRLTRNNYERESINVSAINLTKEITITLKFKPQDIEEVELGYKVTGNLKEDSKHFGVTKKDIALNLDLMKNNKTYSSPEIMQAKPSEFKQPKGEGFETSKTGSKWSKSDLNLEILDILSKNYFYGMGFQDIQILPFINYVTSNMNINEMLRFGRISTVDLARFQAEAERQSATFKTLLK